MRKLKSQFAFASLPVIFIFLVPQNANAQMGNWYQNNQNQLESSQRSQEMAIARCTDTRRTPAERINACTLLIHSDASASENMDVLLSLGAAYRSTGDYEKAISAYSIALDQLNKGALPPSVRDEKISLLTERAMIYAMTNQLDLVQADLGEISATAPDTQTVYSGRCRVEAVIGNSLDGAVADCNKAIAMAPTEAAALDARGLIEFKLGQYTGCIADYDASLARDNHLSSSFYVRGVCKKQSGDAAGGDDDIAKAKALDPSIADTFVKFGVPKPN